MLTRYREIPSKAVDIAADIGRDCGERLMAMLACTRTGEDLVSFDAAARMAGRALEMIREDGISAVMPGHALMLVTDGRKAAGGAVPTSRFPAIAKAWDELLAGAPPAIRKAHELGLSLSYATRHVLDEFGREDLPPGPLSGLPIMGVLLEVGQNRDALTDLAALGFVPAVCALVGDNGSDVSVLMLLHGRSHMDVEDLEPVGHG